MGFFTGHKTADYTVIVGCSRLGSVLASSISARGQSVLVIDKEKEAFRKLPSTYNGCTLTGDATDIDLLEEAHMDKATAVVCVTNNDNTNIMVAQLVKELFKIDNVVTSLCDPERECVCREFGISTVCPAVLSEKEVGRLLFGMKEGASE
jgi:trk system potassium uptake protein TrkA